MADFEIGQEVLDVRGLLGSPAWSQMADFVRATGTTAGTLLSVTIAGTFQAVACRDGVLDFDVAALAEQGGCCWCDPTARLRNCRRGCKVR